MINAGLKTINVGKKIIKIGKKIKSSVKTDGKTGVEMEALTGVQVTLLTIYDMCKAIDKHMVMTDIHLVEKTGGKSGDFLFKEIKTKGGEK